MRYKSFVFTGILVCLLVLGFAQAQAQDTPKTPELPEVTRLKAELFKAHVRIYQLERELTEVRSQELALTLEGTRRDIEAELHKILGPGEIDWNTLTVKAETPPPGKDPD